MDCDPERIWVFQKLSLPFKILHCYFRHYRNWLKTWDRAFPSRRSLSECFRTNKGPSVCLDGWRVVCRSQSLSDWMFNAFIDNTHSCSDKVGTLPSPSFNRPLSFESCYFNLRFSLLPAFPRSHQYLAAATSRECSSVPHRELVLRWERVLSHPLFSREGRCVE